MNKILLGILITFSLNTWAQVNINKIVFDIESIDFGTIPAEGGKVDAVYKFVNLSDQDFEIWGVDVACGCTSPSYTKGIIAPGDTGVVTATFNPFGMVGSVSKWIHVKGNFSDAVHKVLKFKAEIISRQFEFKDSDNTYYRGQYGYLVVYKNTMHFGDRYQNFIGTDSVSIYNDGDMAYTISNIKDLPNYLKPINLPITLQPRTTKHVIFEVNAQIADTVGMIGGTLKLITNDKFFADKPVSYSIDINIDFSELNWLERRKAPKMVVSEQMVMMGNMKSGELKTKTISITNNGKTPLEILRVNTDCTCTILNNLKTTIEPGESIQVEVQFDSLFKSGKQTKGITLFTNDPENSEFIIAVRAMVN